jgi:hypothetical protein
MPSRRQPYLIRANFWPNAEINFDAYPFSIPAVRDIGQMDSTPTSLSSWAKTG